MTAPVLAVREPDPYDGWPTSPGTPHPGGPTGPRYPLLAEAQRAAARATRPGGVAEPLDDFADSYGQYQAARSEPVVRRWVTTCLGPYVLGERCLHRFAAGRLPVTEVCEGCTRLVMDELTGALPDLLWHPDWWKRAGLPEGGPS